MTDDWPTVLARSGLEATYELFPDDVREAFSSAQGLLDRMKADPHYTDEPAHVFRPAREGVDR